MYSKLAVLDKNSFHNIIQNKFTMSHMKVDSLPEPGDRYVLEEEIGVGVWATVKLRLYFLNALIVCQCDNLLGS